MRKGIRTKVATYRIVEHIIDAFDKKHYGHWDVAADSHEVAFINFTNSQSWHFACPEDELPFSKIKKDYYEIKIWVDYYIECELVTFTVRKI